MLKTYYEKLAALDGYVLNFNETGLLVMNITIAFVMFGVALGIKREHFTSVVKDPKLVIIGLIAQYIIMPALSFLLVIVAKMPVSISLGVLLVASCPGGNISNFITSVAKGNVALGVTITAFSDLLSIIMTPFNFTFWGNLYLETLPLQNPIHIPFLEVLKTITLLLGVPLVIGIWFQKKFPVTSKKIYPVLKTISFVVFLLFVVGAITANFTYFSKYFWLLLPVVFIHNGLALSSGYFSAWVTRLSHWNRKTISIEVGIQNSGIALVLIFNNHIFPPGYGGIAFIAAMWGIWHIVSGLGIASIWGLQKEKPKEATVSVDTGGSENVNKE
jgi:bile acid:Na+ symporter, BASS family